MAIPDGEYTCRHLLRRLNGVQVNICMREYAEDTSKDVQPALEIRSIKALPDIDNNYTWVKDVASLTEKGTSRTLASVRARSVFPA